MVGCAVDRDDIVETAVEQRAAATKTSANSSGAARHLGGLGSASATSGPEMRRLT